jgi:poly(A) polymerase
VIDYVGGVPDLEARLIRTIGDPEVRMREDPVRMIRAVRFATKLNFEIEPATRAAIEHHSGDLAKSSVPRLVEEILRTLSFKGAERALFLMEQLGLLEVLLPQLSAHLRASADAAEGDLENTATARNLAALGNVIENDDEPSRPLILACLFADFHHVAVASAGEAQRLMLVEFLRERGFSRADTDHMRLLLEAATHMRMRTRLARRIVRRPYYFQARRFFELIAPTYNVDVEAFDRFLAEIRDQTPRHRRHPSAIPPGSTHRELNATASSAPPGRRRRRRGGRRRHSSNKSAEQILTHPTAPPDGSSLPDRSSLDDAAVPADQPLQSTTVAVGDDAARDAPDHDRLPHPR